MIFFLYLYRFASFFIHAFTYKECLLRFRSLWFYFGIFLFCITLYIQVLVLSMHYIYKVCTIDGGNLLNVCNLLYVCRQRNPKPRHQRLYLDFYIYIYSQVESDFYHETSLLFYYTSYYHDRHITNNITFLIYFFFLV